MPIEVTCTSCKKRLRVPDHAAGKRVKCPGCQAVVSVPAAGGAAAKQPAAKTPSSATGKTPAASGKAAAPAKSPASPKKAAASAGKQPATKQSPAKQPVARPSSAAGKPAAPQEKKPAPQQQPEKKPAPAAPKQWFVQTEDGEQYGPVPKSELDEWLDEGRITAECQLLVEGDDQWQWAADVYPELAGESAAATDDEEVPVFGDAEPPPGISTTGSKIRQAFAFAEADTSPTARIGGKGKTKSKGKAKRKGKSKAAVEPTGEVGSRSKVVAGLLGIFLGFFGVHRFYLGYTKIGIIQIIVSLLTCVGGWWGFIEGIMILVGKFDLDADGNYLKG